MSDVTSSIGSSSPEKPTKGGVLAVLTLIAAGVAGTAAFTDNLGKLGRSANELCQFAKLCAPAPLPTPVLQGYDSSWIEGGHNQNEQCGPLQQQYMVANPSFDIAVKSWEENHKAFLGHVTYRYHCRYTATPK